jgi:hypothetical protein
MIPLSFHGGKKMNQLIAKIRERSKSTSKYRKILSDETIFMLPNNLENAIEYNSSTLLGDDDWFVITRFSTREYFLDLLMQGFDSVDYEQLDLQDFEKLDFLFSYQDGNYFFQNISRVQLVRKKILFLGEQFKFDKNNASIIIKEIPDAIYIKHDDSLYFRKLTSITSIFSGIDQLYREATELETKGFLNSNFISLTNGFSSVDVKTENRKKIALAIDALKKFKSKEKDTIFAYIQGYFPKLRKANNKFSIGSETDLKMLLYGIAQQLYTTPVGNEKRIANSIITLK